MSGMSALLNHMRMQALMASSSKTQVCMGLISSFNPNTWSVKVRLQPDDVETNWLPLAAAWVGDAWGLFAPPSLGDMVDVHFVEGSADAGFVGGRFFTDEERPLPVPSGEFWLVHRDGASLKLSNDGKMVLNSAVEIDASSPKVVIACSEAATITAPHINLGAQGQDLRRLVNEEFMALFNMHTHTVSMVGAVEMAQATNNPMTVDMLTSTVLAG